MSFENMRSEIEKLISGISKEELKRNPKIKNKLNFLKRAIGKRKDFIPEHENYEKNELRFLSHYLGHTFV